MSSKSEQTVNSFKNIVLNRNSNGVNVESKPNSKAVLLYANEKSWFYRRLFLLNICQFFFWFYVSNQGIALILGKPKPKPMEGTEGTEGREEREERKERVEKVKRVVDRVRELWSENALQVCVSLLVLTVGQLSMALLTFFTIRSVRYIQLSPSGRNVRITTFSITGSPNRYRNYDIPLEQVSAAQHRNSALNYIPLKAKGKVFYFLIDTKGHFYKPALFDRTVGLFRILK